MNIFHIDHDPVIAARNLVDKHVVKMILEYAQLMSTAHRILDENDNPILYKATHVNHPSAIWVRGSKENYEWLYDHFVETCKEYTRRYGKIHLTEQKLLNVLKSSPINIPQVPMTKFKCAMPNEYIVDCPVESYRNYYNHAKRNLHSWKIGEHKPEWIT